MTTAGPLPARRGSALDGIRVRELGRGAAVALVGRFLADSGAAVELSPPPGDGPAALEATWHAGKAVAARPVACDDAEWGEYDVCLLGEVQPEPGQPSAATLHAAQPHLVVVVVAGAGPGCASATRHELLAQARTGLVFEQRDGAPIDYATNPATYGAVLHALIGIGAALNQRERDGAGSVVQTSLEQGALSWLTGLWSRWERPDGSVTPTIPKGLQYPIFECSDGGFVQVALGTPGSHQATYQVLGLPSEALPERFAIGDRSPRDYFIDYDAVAPAFARFTTGAALEALAAAGVAAERCEAVGVAWDDEQVVVNGSITTEPGGVQRVAFPIRGL